MDVKAESAVDRSLSAETAVIGALCIDADSVAGLIFHRLRPEDFGNAALRNIYRAASALWMEQRPMDAVTIAAAAGREYEKTIAECMQAVPTLVNTEAYVDILAEEAKLRRIRDLGNKLVFESSSLDAARKFLAEAENLLSNQREDRSWNYSAMLNEYLDRQNSSTPPDYLDWGIQELNERIRISPGRYVVLGADSSVGKTALALQLAYNIARSGKRVGFFSYETSHQDAADRIFANTANVTLSRSKRKELNQLDYEELYREGDHAASISLTVEDSADWTVDDLKARTLAQQYEVIFIDYVQIIPGDSRRPRWEVVTDISMKLHRMASALGVTVVALSQITPPEKGKDGKRRSLGRDDLRESRQLVHDAEVILMMNLTDASNPDSDRELNIEKNKDGKRGRLWLRFDPDHMRFTPCPQPEGQKYAEHRAKMDQVSKKRKAEASQASFEELDGDDEPLPF